MDDSGAAALVIFEPLTLKKKLNIFIYIKYFFY